MKISLKHKKKEEGMALLLVLVAVMALSIIVAGLWEASQPSWEESTLERARFQAGLLAESGLVLASHPDVEPGDVALIQGIGTGKGFQVKISSESGRIPVNDLDNEKLRDATAELFVSWGLDAAAASRAAESIADWVDGNSDRLPNGAENAFYSGVNYPEFPPNTEITSLEEMLFIAGMDMVATYQPMWRDYFTIYSDGLIDLNAAPWELVMSITGTTEDSAINFVAVRNGDDGLEGTVDDYRYGDAGEVQAVLGLSDGEWSEISDLITMSGDVLRIESVGTIGDFKETRVLLARESEENGKRSVVPVARFRK